MPQQAIDPDRLRFKSHVRIEHFLQNASRIYPRALHLILGDVNHVSDDGREEAALPGADIPDHTYQLTLLDTQINVLELKETLLIKASGVCLVPP